MSHYRHGKTGEKSPLHRYSSMDREHQPTKLRVAGSTPACESLPAAARFRTRFFCCFGVGPSACPRKPRRGRNSIAPGAAEPRVDRPPIRKSPNGARFQLAPCASAPQESRPVGPCTRSFPHTQGCAGYAGSALGYRISPPSGLPRARSGTRTCHVAKCNIRQKSQILRIPGTGWAAQKAPLDYSKYVPTDVQNAVFFVAEVNVTRGNGSSINQSKCLWKGSVVPKARS